jgi:LPXTG-motif cell wall-anchored protein
VIKRIYVALTALALVGGGVFVATPALAGNTNAVSTSVTGIQRGALLPNFSVTVGDDDGHISGATFQVLDTWKLNTGLRATNAVMNGRNCGIESVSDGNNVAVPLSDLLCSFRPGGSSSWSAVITFGPADTNAGTAYASPLTVHFASGVFTAPPFATPTTQWRVTARNDDEGVSGLPVTLTFNVVNAVTTPELQSISCEQGVPIESKPLTTTGMTGTVTYSFTDDPPTGVVIDPVTGVISGTPTITAVPQIWVVAIASSHGQIGSAQVYVNQPLPDTGFETAPWLFAGLGLLAAGLVLIATRRLAARKL